MPAPSVGVNAAAVPADAAQPLDASQPIDASQSPDAANASITCVAGTSRHEGTWAYEQGKVTAPLQWCELPDGTKHGAWRKMLANGQLVEDGTYDHGQLDGPWTSYFFPEGGGRSAQGTYVHGVKDGTWQQWWGSGGVSESDVYDHGVLVSSTSFHPNGQVEQRGGFVAGLLSGKWEWFASDGSPTKLVIYVRGKPTRAWRWKNGKRVPIPLTEIDSAR
jgi:antitoxin component YwqK of YwqJK toxin-antitoxin module